jgi:hypothetical protein
MELKEKIFEIIELVDAGFIEPQNGTDRIILLIGITPVPDQTPITCPCCGSDKTYRTEAIHCNRCAVTSEI